MCSDGMLVYLTVLRLTRDVLARSGYLLGIQVA
jgi:hypothetical protein